MFHGQSRRGVPVYILKLTSEVPFLGRKSRKMAKNRVFVFDNETDKRPVVQIASAEDESICARMLLEPLMILDASGLSRDELRSLGALVSDQKSLILKGINVKR